MSPSAGMFAISRVLAGRSRKLSHTDQPLSLWRIFLKGHGIVSLVTLLAAVVFAGLHFVEIRPTLLLNDRAINSTGLITAKSDGLVAADSSLRAYKLEYQFTTSDGRKILGSDTVSKAFYNDVALNEQKPVRYLPGDPSINEIDFSPRNLLIGQYSFIAAILALVAAWLGFHALRSARKAMLLGPDRTV